MSFGEFGGGWDFGGGGLRFFFADKHVPQIELLRGRIGNLRDVEDPNVIFKIDISDWETLKSLMGVYNDGRKSEAVFLRPRYRYRLIEAEANDLDLLAIRIWFLMGVYRILGLEDSEGGLVQS